MASGDHPDSDTERELYYGAAEESHVFLDRVIDIGESMDTKEALILYRHFCPEEKRKNGIMREKYPGLWVINYLRSEKIISVTDISALENAAIELKLMQLEKKIEEHKRILELPVLPIKVKNLGQHSLLENSLSAFRSNKALRLFFRERYNTHLKSCRKGCLTLLLAVSSTESLTMLKTDIQSGVLAKELQSRFGFDKNIKTSFEENLYNDIHQQLTLRERSSGVSTGSETHQTGNLDTADKARSEAQHRGDVKGEVIEGETEGKEGKVSMSTSPSLKSEEKEVAAVESVFTCKEHRANQEVICLTCYTYVCFACAFEYHRDHQVVSLDEMEVNIQDQTKKVHTEFQKLEKQLKYLEDVQMVFEEQIHKPIELELQNFVDESLKVMTVQQEGLLKTVNYITKLGAIDLEHKRMALNEVESVIFVSEEKIKANLYPDIFTKLFELNKIVTKIAKHQNSANEMSHHLKEGSLSISVRPTSTSAKLARISHGCILGAVMASEEQMVVIRSQDNPNTSINLTCASCYDPKIWFWEYTFDCKVGPFPTTVANTLHICPREMGILVGCGRNVSILQVSRTSNTLFFVEKKNCIDVSIPQDSYITGISPIKGKMQDAGIIVSDKESGILQIFDNKYQLIKKVKYHGSFPLITCSVKDDAYKYALAPSKSKSVTLVASHATGEKPREFAKLCFPKNSNLHAQSVFFDGTFFTVLWVSGEETYSKGQQWKVIAYKIDGEEFNVSKEGNCEPNVTAVSISHMKNEGVLCFSNGRVDLFQTCKT